MQQLLAAIQHLRSVQAELSRKEQELHAAISSDDQGAVRNLHEEFAELFQRSNAAFTRVRGEFERIEHRTTPSNAERRP